MKFLRNGVALSLAMFLCFGCASAKKNDGWNSNAPAGASQGEPGAYSPKRYNTTDSTAVDLARIRSIYDDRTTGSGAGDYPIGTGDLIEISVPSMPELEDETVRVTSSGTVTLPMIGDVKAAGLTEKKFKAELQKGLRKYMHRPHVSVHVTEYRSRQVGVLGAERFQPIRGIAVLPEGVGVPAPGIVEDRVLLGQEALLDGGNVAGDAVEALFDVGGGRGAFQGIALQLDGLSGG